MLTIVGTLLEVNNVFLCVSTKGECFMLGEKWIDGFLIIAGDFVDRFQPGAKPSRVFSWKPGTEPKDIGVDFGDLNPEAIIIMGDGDKARILILSDDGEYPDRKGKNAFRGVWLQQAGAPAAGANAPTAARRR